MFRPAFKLVVQLLAAKRDLPLENELKKLDPYDVLIRDDIDSGYQSREDMDVCSSRCSPSGALNKRPNSQLTDLRPIGKHGSNRT